MDHIEDVKADNFEYQLVVFISFDQVQILQTFYKNCNCLLIKFIETRFTTFNKISTFKKMREQHNCNVNYIRNSFIKIISTYII